MTGPGERLVTVGLTLAVPAEADAEDAAGLVADAAVSTTLEVVSAAGVEGHLPVPGSLVVRRSGGLPWRVEDWGSGSGTADQPCSRPAADRWGCHVRSGQLGKVILWFRRVTGGLDLRWCDRQTRPEPLPSPPDQGPRPGITQSGG